MTRRDTCLFVDGIKPDTIIEGEEWRRISWTPNYAVSSLGRVMRLVGGRGVRAGRVLKQCLHTTGYPKVELCTNGKYRSVKVHQVVCEAFHGPKPTPSHQVAHKDGCRTNSRASNLRWATQIENEQDKRRHGTLLYGERHPASKYTPQTIAAIRSDTGTHEAIARKFGISRRYVGYIKAGQRWLYLPGGKRHAS